MDGGRRLLRSLREAAGALAPQAFAFPGLPNDTRSLVQRGAAPSVGARLHRKLQRVARPGGGSALIVMLALVVVGFGAVQGGQYEAFVAARGRPADLVAKAFGFGIKAVTISGTHVLGETDVLAAAGVGPRNSLLFLDVADVRDRLKKIPLIKDVSVAKLFPNRLMIEIEERQPYALWQKDGAVSVVAADGMPIDALTDPRFADLPLVVGAGANAHLQDFMQVLDAAGDLRARVRAGMFVAERRWTLKMTNGVDVELPEEHPAAAMVPLLRAQADAHLLDRDVVEIDLRDPQRIVVRLGDVAAAARADMLARKPKTKSGVQ